MLLLSLSNPVEPRVRRPVLERAPTLTQKHLAVSAWQSLRLVLKAKIVAIQRNRYDFHHPDDAPCGRRFVINFGFGGKKLLLIFARFAVRYLPHGLGFRLGCRLRPIGLLNVRIVQGQAFLRMVAGRDMSTAALVARHCRNGCESQCNPDNYVTAHDRSALIVLGTFILADACKRMGQRY